MLYSLLYVDNPPVKDKKSVLLELEEIKVERDELREQVNSLTTDLEKERTKVHTIKDEMYKLKVSSLIRPAFIIS